MATQPRQPQSGALRGPHPGVALGILTGLNLLNYLDRYVGAAVVNLVKTDLRLSDFRAGLLQSSFIVSYSLISPFIGVLGDRKARMPLAAAGVVLWSLATIGSGLAPTFALLLLARALTGIGESSYAVVTPSLISDLYPSERRGRALSVFYAAIFVGTALGYALGGQVGERLGWRAAFLIAGAPGAVLGAALFFLREPPRGAFDRPAAGGGARASSSWRGLLARPSYVYNTTAQIIYTFSMGGLAYWMPAYLQRERGIPLGTATWMFGGILVLAGLGGTLLGGTLGDRLSKRLDGGHFALSGFTLIASLPFTLLAVLSPSPAIFWPSMFVTLFLLCMNTGPLNAAMANVLPPELRARGFAVYMMAIHLLGDAASPPLIGLASDRVGLRIPVLATGVLLVASGLVLLRGRLALERDLRAAAI